MRRNYLLNVNMTTYLFFLIFMFFIAGCKNNSTDYPTSPTTNSNPPADEIWMQNTSYNPSTKTVTAGTTIKWINKDSFNHTVTSGSPGHPDGLFDSGVIGPGGTYTHTFNSAGSFNYYCSIHQDIMTGTVTVQ